MNLAVISLYGLYTTTYVHSFVVVAPNDVLTWDTTYCNATMTALANNPYPTRLLCSVITTTSLLVLIPPGVVYQPTITETYTVTINCRFQLVDFPTPPTLYVTGTVLSATFNAYGSFANIADPNPQYFITQTSTTITIS